MFFKGMDELKLDLLLPPDGELKGGVTMKIKEFKKIGGLCDEHSALPCFETIRLQTDKMIY